MEKTNNKFVSTQQIATLLGVTRQTIRNWINKGNVRAHHIGQNLKIPSGEARRILQYYGLPIPEWLEGGHVEHPAPSRKDEEPRETAL